MIDSAPHSEQNVVVIEDDADTRDAIREVLEAEGYRVTDYGEGGAALAALERSAAPKLIVLDLMMPGLNGWQFLECRRCRDELASVPVLVLSADSRAARDPRSLHGAAFLPKPVSLDELICVVRRLIETSR